MQMVKAVRTRSIQGQLLRWARMPRTADRRGAALALAVAFFIFSGIVPFKSALAQSVGTAGTIEGIVTDSSGAVVAGAKSRCGTR